MKKVITICAVVCLMLSFGSVSWATTVVSSPPGAPGWWNSQDAPYYAYGWWSADLLGGGPPVSPPNDPTHWASNFLPNTAFTANIGIVNQTISVNLQNVYRPDLYKEIYLYITGTTVSTVQNVDTVLDTDGGVFSGSQTWNINQNGEWDYVLEGEIHPQPAYVNLTFTVPGMTSVTNIWAGENCVPEPLTMVAIGMGIAGLGGYIRRRRMAAK